MKNIVTITTSNYIKYTQRLLISLLKTNQDFELTIFCDFKENFQLLEKLGHCTLIELPEIEKLGVKRAKFKAYYNAAINHDFLYLDSDIIVLDSLDELFDKTNITGCFDDLSHCPFIDNKEFPWQGQSLKNNVFINSGVFFAPRSMVSFFEDIYKRSLLDEEWNKYSIQGKLLDNHFLCAMFNLLDIEVEYIDENIYNWQGFLFHGVVQVYRHGKDLLNIRSHQKLKVVHFAGISEIDDFIIHLPIEIASLLAEYMLLQDNLQEESHYYFLADLSKSLDKQIEDSNITRIVQDFFNEIKEIKRNNFQKDYSHAATYLLNKTNIISWAYSQPITPFKWNGLFHGGSYLTGNEYAYLRKLIKDYDIRSVLETGAGETSILFRELVENSFSIEPFPGPWLERSREKGCQVFQIDFIPENLKFSENGLSTFFAEINIKEFDLFFLDSPPGTENRSKIIEQMLEHVNVKYILVHDIYRDSKNIFSFINNLGLNQLDYFPSERGMVLLGKSKAKLHTSDAFILDRKTLANDPDFYIKFMDTITHRKRCAKEKINIELTNKSSFTFSSHYDNPIHVSYHWFDANKQLMVFDGIRTVLPFNLFSNDIGEFTIDILTPDEEGEFYLHVDLVQEGIAWFQNLNPSLIFIRQLSIVN